MNLSDIVAACFPAFVEKGEAWIKTGHTLPRLLFRKRATLQPARDRGMAYPNLVEPPPSGSSRASVRSLRAGIERGAPLASPASAVRLTSSISATVWVARFPEVRLLPPCSGGS